MSRTTAFLGAFLAAMLAPACQRSDAAKPAAAANARSGAANLRGANKRCATFSSHAEEIACLDRIAAASRATMLQMLEANRRNARAFDADYDASFPKHANNGHSSLLASLNTSQAAWDNYTRSQCNYDSDKSFGGSGGWDFKARCKDRLNLQRIGELQNILAADRDSRITRK